MSEGKILLHCYNRGCGKQFDPNDNKEGKFLDDLIHIIKTINFLRMIITKMIQYLRKL